MMKSRFLYTVVVIFSLATCLISYLLIGTNLFTSNASPSSGGSSGVSGSVGSACSRLMSICRAGSVYSGLTLGTLYGNISAKAIVYVSNSTYRISFIGSDNEVGYGSISPRYDSFIGILRQNLNQVYGGRADGFQSVMSISQFKSVFEKSPAWSVSSVGVELDNGNQIAGATRLVPFVFTYNSTQPADFTGNMIAVGQGFSLYQFVGPTGVALEYKAADVNHTIIYQFSGAGTYFSVYYALLCNVFNAATNITLITEIDVYLDSTYVIAINGTNPACDSTNSSRIGYWTKTRYPVPSYLQNNAIHNVTLVVYQFATIAGVRFSADVGVIVDAYPLQTNRYTIPTFLYDPGSSYSEFFWLNMWNTGHDGNPYGYTSSEGVRGTTSMAAWTGGISSSQSHLIIYMVNPFDVLTTTYGDQWKDQILSGIAGPFTASDVLIVLPPIDVVAPGVLSRFPNGISQGQMNDYRGSVSTFRGQLPNLAVSIFDLGTYFRKYNTTSPSWVMTGNAITTLMNISAIGNLSSSFGESGNDFPLLSNYGHTLYAQALFPLLNGIFHL